MATVECLVMGLIMVLLRNISGHAYSNDTQVVKHFAAMMPWLALTHLVSGTQCVLLGKSILVFMSLDKHVYFSILSMLCDFSSDKVH